MVPVVLLRDNELVFVGLHTHDDLFLEQTRLREQFLQPLFVALCCRRSELPQLSTNLSTSVCGFRAACRSILGSSLVLATTLPWCVREGPGERGSKT